MSLLRISWKCMRRSSKHFSDIYRIKTVNRPCATEALVTPSPSDSEKQYPEKLKRITEEISKLTLLEVSQLNSLLKTTLNIPDAPVMAFGSASAAAAPSPAEEDDEETTKESKTSFAVKLLKFEPEKKIALIKEVKNLMEGMNLVQAKKFVEELPRVVKADVSKDEAERLKQAMEAVGGICEID
ncbi:39S ribosomal protein L12, mitochondrial-like [Centruroides sculpturatus]|uniref:39S ribosomal protein L12, mitochondrial-like n=1 Tax=Centruroides sculpturatus TaxID=218467 RepID=UPI000C6D65A0|nr:39S ribosomal protein L12, mitochondrial-like [Centruroides sculpturatus]